MSINCIIPFQQKAIDTEQFKAAYDSILAEQIRLTASKVEL
ncbi:hypothetical protein [Paenibacillus foliorum]|nr:hypothetical protein [Paenibacillus foliorum]